MLMKWSVNALVAVMAASIPTLIFCAFYFNNGDLLWWIVIPIIFFMAG